VRAIAGYVEKGVIATRFALGYSARTLERSDEPDAHTKSPT